METDIGVRVQGVDPWYYNLSMSLNSVLVEAYLNRGIKI